MNSLRILVGLTIFAAVHLEQDKGPGVEDVIKTYEKHLRSIEGVREIAADQSGAEPTIIIRVESKNARDTIALLMGEKISGYPVKILLSSVPLSESQPANADGTTQAAVDLTCTHCPIHCTSNSHLTVVDPTPSPNPGLTKVEVPASETTSWDHCDVARKWLGLPRRGAPQGGACEVMVSWSDDPTKVKWALAQRLPHWRSKDMVSIRGSDKTGIPCPEHGSHNQGEFVCYTWIKHNPQCPLVAIVAPKDLLSPASIHAEAPKANR